MVVLIAGILVLLGYGLVFLVFRENRYASRIVEVEPSRQSLGVGHMQWFATPCI